MIKIYPVEFEFQLLPLKAGGPPKGRRRGSLMEDFDNCCKLVAKSQAPSKNSSASGYRIYLPFLTHDVTERNVRVLFDK